MRKGLTENIERIIDSVASMDGIRPYVLCGGTALAMQLGHRKSEDLDFMAWRISKDEKPEVDWPALKSEIESKVGPVDDVDILGFDHVVFLVCGVKISFYVSDHRSPLSGTIPYLGNIVLADVNSILAMKLEVMLRRAKFRDYYDIYSIVRSGADLNEGIDNAIRYSEFHLKRKNVVALLLSGRYDVDQNFKQLDALYDVSFEDIRLFFVDRLKR